MHKRPWLYFVSLSLLFVACSKHHTALDDTSSDAGRDSSLARDGAVARRDSTVAMDTGLGADATTMRDAGKPPKGWSCGEVPAPTKCAGGFTQTYVISMLDWDVADYDEQGDPISSEGFDLDCTPEMSCPCAQDCQDLPETGASGTVDNQFAYLGPVLEQALSLNDALDQSIERGRMLLVVQLEGLDATADSSLASDDCVDVHFYPAKTLDDMPPKLRRGQLSGGQRLVALSEYLDVSGQALIRGKGWVEQGELRVQLPHIPLSIDSGRVDFDIEVSDVFFELELGSTTSASGIFAGRIDVDRLLASLNMWQPGLGAPGSLISNLLRGFADLAASEKSDRCTQLSMSMQFDAVNASLDLP